MRYRFFVRIYFEYFSALIVSPFVACMQYATDEYDGFIFCRKIRKYEADLCCIFMIYRVNVRTATKVLEYFCFDGSVWSGHRKY